MEFDIVEIRDMCCTCKKCKNVFFPEDINAKGLCEDCANGSTKEKSPVKPDEWDF